MYKGILYVLTYKENVILTFDIADGARPLNTIAFPNLEGWGLTFDGNSTFYASTGSANVIKLDANALHDLATRDQQRPDSLGDSEAQHYLLSALEPSSSFVATSPSSVNPAVTMAQDNTTRTSFTGAKSKKFADFPYISDSITIRCNKGPPVAKTGGGSSVPKPVQKPTKYINELEWVDGQLVANLWLENTLLSINPATGTCDSAVNLSKTTKLERATAAKAYGSKMKKAAEMNGIAAFKGDNGKKILMTGKDWSSMFLLDVDWTPASPTPNGRHTDDFTRIPSLFLDVVSVALGFAYVFCWAISFYPQAILNYKRKSTEGMSNDLVLYNVTAYTMYAYYVLVRRYVQNRDHLSAAVEFHDVIFALHSLTICIFLLSQAYWYNHGGGWRLASKSCTLACSGFSLLFLVIICLARYRVIPFYLSKANGVGGNGAGAQPQIFFSGVGQMPYVFPNISAALFGAYVKVILTFIKYIPQILLTYRRKSTKGLSISQWNLDLAGGVFALSQNLIDAYNYSDPSYVYGNVPKFLLAMIGVFYDSILVIQHYCIYTDRETAATKAPPYLQVGSSDFELAKFEGETHFQDGRTK
eukprot:GHVU01048342.1.p1 GENE.GHVU01048342.1~~GHVU01048342.1.p1  ORF type:complete len:586 (+),score=63.91 GHVU01048342.1:1205-2962(+)